jgi:hypothetical protein
MPFTIPDNDTVFNSNQSVWFATDIAILAASLAGVGVVSGCDVTAQGSPNMTVAVAAGYIRIASGFYIAVAAGNVTIGTADATNPRIDLISVSDTGTKTCTAGTAAAAPKPPALPSGHVGLAFVYVPATDTTIETDHITDKRAVLSNIHYRISSLTVGASSTAFIADADVGRTGSAFFDDTGGNSGAGMMQWYRAGTFNSLQGVATSGHGYEFRGSTYSGGSVGFSFFIENNTAGGRLGVKNNNAGFGRTFTFRIFQGSLP